MTLVVVLESSGPAMGMRNRTWSPSGSSSVPTRGYRWARGWARAGSGSTRRRAGAPRPAGGGQQPPRGTRRRHRGAGDEVLFGRRPALDVSGQVRIRERKPRPSRRRPNSHRSDMGAALLRRRPKGLLPAARQELLDPSKAWWGGRRGRLADRPRYSISVSLGVVPRWYSRVVEVPVRIEVAAFVAPGASEPPLATRRIQTRAWMKQRYWVAPACTSELHHGRGPGTARPFDDGGLGDGNTGTACRPRATWMRSITTP